MSALNKSCSHQIFAHLNCLALENTNCQTVTMDVEIKSPSSVKSAVIYFNSLTRSESKKLNRENVKRTKVQEKCAVLQCVKLEQYLKITTNADDIDKNADKHSAQQENEIGLRNEKQPAERVPSHYGRSSLVEPKTQENKLKGKEVPPDLEAKRILEDFERKISPYNTFTVSREDLNVDLFKQTFELFPEVRRSLRDKHRKNRKKGKEKER